MDSLNQSDCCPLLAVGSQTFPAPALQYTFTEYGPFSYAKATSWNKGTKDVGPTGQPRPTTTNNNSQ